MDIQQSPHGPRVGCEARIAIDAEDGTLAAHTGAYLDLDWPAGAPNFNDIQPGKKVVVNGVINFPEGYKVGDARVSELGVLRVQCVNVTAGELVPDSQNVDVMVLG